MQNIGDEIFQANQETAYLFRTMHREEFASLLQRISLTQLIVNFSFLRASVLFEDFLLMETLNEKLRRNEKVQFNRIRDVDRFETSLFNLGSQLLNMDSDIIRERLRNILILGLNLIVYKKREIDIYRFTQIFNAAFSPNLDNRMAKVLGNCLTTVVKNKSIYRWLSLNDYDFSHYFRRLDYIFIPVKIQMLKLFLGKTSFKILAPLAFALYQYNLDYILKKGSEHPDLIKQELTLENLERIIIQDKKTNRLFRRLILGRTDILIRDPKFPSYLSRGQIHMKNNYDIEL